MHKKPIYPLLAGATCVLLSACGGTATTMKTTSAHTGTAAQQPKPVSGHTTIEIRDFMYHPMHLTVTPGTKVTFHNEDQTSHTATALNGAFDTGTIKPDQSVTVVLRKLGTDRYHCLFHAFMIASIVVKQ